LTGPCVRDREFYLDRFFLVGDVPEALTNPLRSGIGGILLAFGRGTGEQGLDLAELVPERLFGRHRLSFL
jgi:hypothetical protein